MKCNLRTCKLIIYQDGWMVPIKWKREIRALYLDFGKMIPQLYLGATGPKIPEIVAVCGLLVSSWVYFLFETFYAGKEKITTNYSCKWRKAISLWMVRTRLLRVYVRGCDCYSGESLEGCLCAKDCIEQVDPVTKNVKNVIYFSHS